MRRFWKCPDCGLIFPDGMKITIYTTYEAFFDSPVPGHTPIRLDCCPRCDCPGLEEYEPQTEEEADDLEAL